MEGGGEQPPPRYDVDIKLQLRKWMGIWASELIRSQKRAVYSIRGRRKDHACVMLGQQDQTSKTSVGMLCVAFVKCSRRLGGGRIRSVALLLVADAILK